MLITMEPVVFITIFLQGNSCNQDASFSVLVNPLSERGKRSRARKERDPAKSDKIAPEKCCRAQHNSIAKAAAFAHVSLSSQTYPCSP
jgi:hypothetical protein